MEAGEATGPAGTGTTATGPSLSVFSRRSSGLVRAFSLFDATLYGVLAAGALYGLFYVFPVPQASMPGLDLPLSTLIAMLLMIPVFAVYAGLGSAMPRIGGDYLYQSRAIHPAVGFTFTFAWEVFMWVTFTTTGAYVINVLGLQPLLYNLGLIWNSKSLIDASSWFAGADGILFMSLALVALAFLTTIAGLGAYRKIQRYIILPTIVVSNIVLVLLLLRSHGSFISHFNAFHEKALGVSNYAAKVTSAHAAVPGFSLKYTLLFLSVTGIVWYVVFSAQGLLGETKQANNFKRLYGAFAIGGLYLGLVAWVLPTFVFQQTLGKNFLYHYVTTFNGGKIEAPAGASIPSFAMMMTTSPIVSILLALGFITIGYYFATCVFLNMTRVMTAMGMDRTLPEWFSKVNERVHAPVNAAIFYLVICVAMNLLFRWDSSVQTTMLFGGAFTSVGVIAVTGLAGVLFTTRAKGVYDVSPVSKYKIFGVPLIVVAGIITFVAAGAVTVANLLVPELGFTTTSARLLLLLSLVVSAAWYYAYRAYLRRAKGVNIDLAFKQIPPE